MLLLIMLVNTVSAGAEREINEKLLEGNVKLDAKIYTLDDSIKIPGDRTLEGVPGTIITIPNDAGWKQYKGLIEPLGSDVSNITIQGFEMDGNEPGQPEACGNCYYTLILLDGCSDVTVRNMYLHDNNNDGIRILNSNLQEGNIRIYNNRFIRCYHNGVYLTKVTNAEIYDNYFMPRTNAGICVADSNHISIHDNEINAEVHTGGAGMEIQKTTSVTMDDIDIYNNDISNTNLAGIWLYGYNSYEVPDSAKDVSIKNNRISACGEGRGTDRYYGGGIAIGGFNNTVVEGNTVTDCYNEGISMFDMWKKPPEFDYVTVLKDNVVSDTQKGTYRSGINIYAAEDYSYTSEGAVPDRDDWKPTHDDDDDEDVHIIPKEDDEKVEPVHRDQEFEFESVFSILELGFYVPALPARYSSPNSCNISIYDNGYMPQTRFEVETDNLTSKVVYEYSNTSSTHYLWTATSRTELCNINMWELEGQASRVGNDFMVPGEDIEASESVDIYIYDTAGRKTKVTNFNTTVYKEDLTDAVNPLAYLLVAMIALVCAGISLNLAVTYGKLKRRYKR